MLTRGARLCVLLAALAPLCAAPTYEGRGNTPKMTEGKSRELGVRL